MFYNWNKPLANNQAILMCFVIENNSPAFMSLQTISLTLHGLKKEYPLVLGIVWFHNSKEKLVSIYVVQE